MSIPKPVVIALVSDFGISDHYVGTMKGVILNIAPGATIVDITHGIEPPPDDGPALIAFLGSTIGNLQDAEAIILLRGVREAMRCQDRFLLGVGSARGRRSLSTLRINDVIDFWRVEELVDDNRVLLRAEMKVPGRAWLTFDIEPIDEGRTRIRQTARFEPSGLWGRLYWYALLPVHAVIFAGMLREIARRATAHDGRPVPGVRSARLPRRCDS